MKTTIPYKSNYYYRLVEGDLGDWSFQLLGHPPLKDDTHSTHNEWMFRRMYK